MFYVKNLHSWERVVRVIVFLAVAIVPVFYAVPYAWLWVVGGISMAMTGVVGWCPACYLAGRKLKQQADDYERQIQN